MKNDRVLNAVKTISELHSENEKLKSNLRLVKSDFEAMIKDLECSLEFRHFLEMDHSAVYSSLRNDETDVFDKNKDECVSVARSLVIRVAKIKALGYLDI